MKIQYLTLHRNGVANTPFYSCILTHDYNKDEHYLITFEGTDSDTSIKRGSTRVVSIEKPGERKRGDDFEYKLNVYFRNEFKEERANDIFHLTLNHNDRDLMEKEVYSLNEV